MIETEKPKPVTAGDPEALAGLIECYPTVPRAGLQCGDEGCSPEAQCGNESEVE